MREQTSRALLIALACMTVAGFGACNSEPKICDKVGGHYQPLYTPLDGTCGLIANPNMVPFDGGLHGVNTIMESLGNAKVTTDIVMKGCTVHMTQKVQGGQANLLQQEIDGEQIHIENTDRLSGNVFLTKYDGAGAFMCSGNYNAAFTKNTATVGSAAAGIAGSHP